MGYKFIIKFYKCFVIRKRFVITMDDSVQNLFVKTSLVKISLLSIKIRNDK